jgi:hypothetical protein
MIAAVAEPLVTHLAGRRQEDAAAEWIASLRSAQERFRSAAGGYATDLSALASACPGGTAVWSADALAALASMGYQVALRSARHAAVGPSPCGGAPMASDYYVAVAPRQGTGPAQRAFAATARGDIFVFFDGIAPHEQDIASGLATPLAEADRFVIP